MSTYQILCLLGVGSLNVTLLGFLLAKIKKYACETKAVKLGLQAILRDRLIQLYRTCNKMEYANITDRENFQNMYNQYHNLGANGVMDDIKEKFFDLPTEPKEDDTDDT